MLPSLDAHARASEFAAALLYAIPIFLAVAAPWLGRYVSEAVTPGRLAAFAVFALVVDLAMLRNPFPARAPDAVVLPAIAFGCCVAAVWRAAGRSTAVRRALLRTSTAASVCVVTMSVAGAGQFLDRINWLAGRWTSLRLARGAWTEVYGELSSSPQLSYFRDRPASVSLRLAAYVRECVPPADRLLVLWFAPEIYYHADRLMAQRHLVFIPPWSSLAQEQRMTLEKIRRFKPPLALARRSSLEAETRATYPAVVEYVSQEYDVVGTIDENGEQYLIFARRDRAPLRRFSGQTWPCYSTAPSSWWRVGREANEKG